MKTIIVRYYHSKLPDLNYKGDEHYPDTKRKRNKIVDDILKSGYNVMIQQTEGYIIIWIDKYRFQQR